MNHNDYELQNFIHFTHRDNIASLFTVDISTLRFCRPRNSPTSESHILPYLRSQSLIAILFVPIFGLTTRDFSTPTELLLVHA